MSLTERILLAVVFTAVCVPLFIRAVRLDLERRARDKEREGGKP